MTAWLIWSQRNQIRVQQPHCNLDQLAQLAMDQQVRPTRQRAH